MDIVITAAKIKYINGIPAQLLEIDGEKILFRTIRLLKERFEEIYLIVPRKGFFGETGCIEIVGHDKSGMGRFLNFNQFKGSAIFFYGDVYFTEEAIETILKDRHRWWFFGRYGISHISKKGGELFAVKANRWLMNKAQELKDKAEEVSPKRCICWELYRYVNGYKLDVHYVKDRFTEICDSTDDFDAPRHLTRWMEGTRRLKGGTEPDILKPDIITYRGDGWWVKSPDKLTEEEVERYAHLAKRSNTIVVRGKVIARAK